MWKVGPLWSSTFRVDVQGCRAWILAYVLVKENAENVLVVCMFHLSEDMV